MKQPLWGILNGIKLTNCIPAESNAHCNLCTLSSTAWHRDSFTKGWPGSFAHSNVILETVRAIFFLYLGLLHDNVFIFCPPSKEVLPQMLPSCLQSHCRPPGVPPPEPPPFRPPGPVPAGSAALAGLSPGPYLLLGHLWVALPSSIMATLLSPSLLLGTAPSALPSPGWRGYQMFSSPSSFPESHFSPQSPLGASAFGQRCPGTRAFCTGLSQLSVRKFSDNKVWKSETISSKSRIRFMCYL